MRGAAGNRERLLLLSTSGYLCNTGANMLCSKYLITACSLSLSLFFAAHPVPAHASTVTVLGILGIDGVNGVGAAGTDGGPGGDAPATAVTSTDSSNTATATGGAGGSGGSGDVGFNGGNGGAGGNTSAICHNDDDQWHRQRFSFCDEFRRSGVMEVTPASRRAARSRM